MNPWFYSTTLPINDVDSRMTAPKESGHSAAAGTLALALFCASVNSLANTAVSVADAKLDATFYSDASCLLTIDTFVQSGKTVIDADVDAVGSRMLIHCDTDDGRRLTLLARGDSLNVEQRAPLLGREEIAEGEYGMIAWLTRAGVHYTDDTAPRRYVIGGSVKLTKSPPIDMAGSALNSSRQSFASINGVLEPVVKSDDQLIPLEPLEPQEPPSEESPGPTVTNDN